MSQVLHDPQHQVNEGMNTVLESLDDHLLHVIAALVAESGHDNVIALGCTSRRFLQIVKTSYDGWTGLLLRGFGLPTHSNRTINQAEAGAAGSSVADAPALEQYRQLVSAGQQQRFSPFRNAFLRFVGLSTDGGCDMPVTDYWVGHVFRATVRATYCSDAGTRNVHCLGVLAPLQAYGEAEAAERRYLLDRLQVPAAYLFQDVTEDVLGLPEQWTDRDLRRVVLPRQLPPPDDDTVHDARNMLNECSTQGLQDLYLHAYEALDQRTPWGCTLRLPRNSPSLPALQTKAAQVWLSLSQLPQLDTGSIVLPPQPPPAPASGAAQGAGPSSSTPPHGAAAAAAGSWPRRFMYDQAAQQQLLQPGLGATLGVFSGVVIRRPVEATCPVRCGIVYAGLCGSGSSSSGSGSHGGPQRTQPGGAGGGSSSSSVDGGVKDGQALGQPPALALSAALARLPCVQALQDVQEAAQVMQAAREGRLPPVAGYYCSKAAEWIEFERPATHLPTPNDAAAGTAADSAAGGGASPLAPPVPVHTFGPLVWFRYYTRAERQARAQLAAQRKLAAGTTAESMDSFTQAFTTGMGVGAGADAGTPQPPGPADPREEREVQQAADGTAVAAEDGGNSDHANDDTDDDNNIDWMSGDDDEEEGEEEEEEGLLEAEQQPLHAAGAPADPWVAAQQAPAAAAMAQQEGTASGSGGGAGSSLPAPQLAPQPVEAPDSGDASWFPLSPLLGAQAPEVAAAFGWGPSSSAYNQLRIMLKQPWVANLLLVKLISPEDRRPAFNAARGGCNIDCGMVALQGLGLVRLHQGLQLGTMQLAGRPAGKSGV